MTPYILMMVGLVLASNVAAKPVQHEDDSNSIETEPSSLYGWKGGDQADLQDKGAWKEIVRLADLVRASKKLAEQKSRGQREEELGPEVTKTAKSEETSAEPTMATLTDTTTLPVVSHLKEGKEKILDHLHEATGEKWPVYHSALDGWVI